MENMNAVSTENTEGEFNLATDYFDSPNKSNFGRQELV